YLIPLIYCLVVYGLTWLSGLGLFPSSEFVDKLRLAYGGSMPEPVLILVYAAGAGTLGVLGSLVSALGEEIGWRGLFVPELAKITSFQKTALISGAVWAAWHLPLILFADYNLSGAPKWYAALMFIVMVMGISFVFAWLRLKSGSLWTAALLHASHNLFVQGIFTPLTGTTSITPYIIDEFGVGLALAALVLAFIFWRKAGDLPAVEEAQL
ncbi:MAG: CPBP family intramembrane metalloprotease, partial [Anaerolineae bacterium]|nr:CPBP family intramembrane metalloprotease [Anaerolineae bacterium]